MLCMLMHLVGHRHAAIGPGNGDDVNQARHETPRDILDRHYARGELSREQYEELKRTLNTSGDKS